MLLSRRSIGARLNFFVVPVLFVACLLQLHHEQQGKEKVCFPTENKQGACAGVLTGDPSKSNMGLVVLQEWWGYERHHNR